MAKRPITGSWTPNTPVTFVIRLRVAFKPSFRMLAIFLVLTGTVLLTDRVLQYLATAEWQEVNPWYRDDLRIAWITTLEASRGNPQPFTDATYRVLGVHPDNVFQLITARRVNMLGAQYADFFPDNSAPKKPCASVGNEGLSVNARVKTDRAS